MSTQGQITLKSRMLASFDIVLRDSRNYSMLPIVKACVILHIANVKSYDETSVAPHALFALP
jgi:hypothetical protein